MTEAMTLAVSHGLLVRESTVDEDPGIYLTPVGPDGLRGKWDDYGPYTDVDYRLVGGYMYTEAVGGDVKVRFISECVHDDRM